MIKIVIICHTFQKKEYYHRWELLAERHSDMDITLLAPTNWSWGTEKGLTYGFVEKVEGKSIEKDNFRIRLIKTSKDRLTDWTSKDMKNEILRIKPDAVYLLSTHTQLAFTQLLHLRNSHKELSDTKILCFSMRGHQQSLEFNIKRGSLKKDIRAFGGYLYTLFKLKYFNRYTDAVFCHYPDAVSEFRREGYKRHIFMQTQVGYDPEVFKPDSEMRKQIREKYGIGDDEFVFGSASRFHYSKGLSEIIRALPEDKEWKYLMMGWGTDEEVNKIKEEISARGLDNRIILTGYITDQKEMAAHWNALDCAVHAPLTTKNWEETFSLALIQAMGTRLPVIGSSSGSVPYQIGEEGIIIPEGDVDAMREKMYYVLSHPDEIKQIGERMYQRSYQCFNIYKLNELWYLTIIDLLSNKYDPEKSDMVGFWKAKGDYTCIEK